MKVIDVKEQPKLSLRRTMEICINGVRYRLFRSTVTVLVIGVAIAFMMNIVCEAISMQSVARVVRQRTSEQRLGAMWTSRLSTVSSLEAILQEVARARNGDPLLAEAQAFGGMTAGDFAAFKEEARQADAYLTFFETLNYGDRRILVSGTATGHLILDRLQDKKALQNLTTQLAAQHAIRFITTPEAFTAFLAEWPVVKKQTEAIKAGRDRAVVAITLELQGKSILKALAGAEGPFGETVINAGFTAFAGNTRVIVARQAGYLQQMQTVEGSLDNRSLRGIIAGRLNLTPGDIKPAVLWGMLRNDGQATWYLKTAQKNGVDTAGLTVAELAALSGMKAQEASLDRALRLTQETGGGVFGIGDRMTWLVLVSLLVCAVGISNAMLMSVTERFREIATLKCLGALDEFIMHLFLVEACLLGLVGALIGGLAGSIIGFARMYGTLGSVLFSAFPTMPWLAGLGLALVVGVFLAAIAGVYPSYIAARLAPMEAMRIE